MGNPLDKLCNLEYLLWAHRVFDTLTFVEERIMTPAQVQGLWICFSFSLAMVLLTPILVWVLPNRQQPV
ncbi:hypothetical protein N836_27615 [Leptolyngbya sp. Heron Island J]|nr:hypothetical protein N836_27615 [Leptolyngbya sp. Heron Island J]